MKGKVVLCLCLVFGYLSLNAKEIEVVFSRTTPPFVFESGDGINVDITREALKYKNHTLKPVFVNIARGVEMFKTGLVDANALLQERSDVKGFYSDIFTKYQNCFFTLKSSNITIEKMEDIKNYHTIGFQNANIYLGERFGTVAKSAGEKYTELADQKKQVLMFYKGHTQGVVMDKSIFRYYTEMLISEKKIEPSIEVVENCLFEPTEYQIAFKEKEIRDDFNDGLKYIRGNGIYDEIYERYGKKYFEIKR